MGANGRIAALEVLARPRPEGGLGDGDRRLRRHRRRWRPQRPGRGRYLGKAGLRTLVLERRERVGGAAATSELAPGARVPTLAHTVGRLRPSVVRDLDLKAPRTVAGRPGRARLRAGSGRAARSSCGRDAGADRRGPARRVRRRDAGRYAAFDGLVRALAGLPGRHRRSDAAGHRGARPRRRAHRAQARADVPWPRAVRRRGPSPASCRWPSPTSSRNRSRPTRSRRRSRGVAIQYTAMGPWSAGTTAVLLADSAGNDGGAAGQTVFARGGPGALAAALAAAAQASGVEIRTGAEVVAITSRRRSRDRRRPGRRRGDRRAARSSSRHRPEAHADPPGRPGRARAEPPAGGSATSGRRARSPRSTSRCAALPRFTGRPATTPALLRGRIVIAPGIDAMERADDDAKYGRASRRRRSWRRPSRRWSTLAGRGRAGRAPTS